MSKRKTTFDDLKTGEGFNYEGVIFVKIEPEVIKDSYKEFADYRLANAKVPGIHSAQSYYTYFTGSETVSRCPINSKK